MTTFDWITDITLIALVLLQLRARKLGPVQLLLPIALVALAVWHYFTTWPATTNGMLLVSAAVTAGVLLGLGSGAFTQVWSDGESVIAKATTVSAVLWVAGMGTRLLFQLWALSDTGAKQLMTFSIQHTLDQAAWVDALLLMAVGQVLTRTLVLTLRRRARSKATTVPTAAVLAH